MRTRAPIRALAIAATLLACDEPTFPGPRRGETLMSALVVSEPIGPASSSGTSLLSHSGDTYVSLVPGLLLDGAVARVANLTTHAVKVRSMVEGGLDPVPLAASVGDQLRVTVERADLLEIATLDATVSITAAPRVVRTAPARRKTGVPLNVRIIIVFSEPMSETAASGVTLWRKATGVGGQATLSADGLSVDFQPDALLEPSTDYIIVVDRNVTDRTGRSLGEPMLVEFTTVPASSPSPDSAATSPDTVATIGEFVATGAMVSPRYHHQATLLLDGRVLITGGAGRSAELYDPVTGTFAPTGAMIEARIYSQATLLLNGKVLVVGPTMAEGAELYDPSAGAFTRTGSMHSEQGVQAMSRLLDGNVLVVGDSGAEVFDVGTGAFRPAGQYAPDDYFWYFGHNATLLNDGRVLVDGTCTQVYAPLSDTFRNAGCVAAELQTSTLLSNGKVLVAGGMMDECTNAGRCKEAFLFDPASNQFARTGNLQTARDAHAAVRLSDGRVLIVGGDGGSGCGGSCYSGSERSAELYDPAMGTFVKAGNMRAARTSPQATLLQSGDVLITGGLQDAVTAELYRPAAPASAIVQPRRTP